MTTENKEKIICECGWAGYEEDLKRITVETIFKMWWYDGCPVCERLILK